MFKIDGDAKELLEIQVNQKRNQETIKENQKVAEIGCLQLWLMVCSTTVSEQMIIAQQTWLTTEYLY